METQTSKNERIEIRVSAQEKEILKKAQQLNGDASLSSFALKTLKDSAENIIEKNNRILASERDQESFFNAIYSDLQPNEDLVAAANNYKGKNAS